MRLKNKIAIVTGGASGFGAGIVSKFLAEGAQVMIADLNGDAASAAAQAHGENTRSFEVDVSDDARMAALVKASLDAFGRIDILVNNAGIGHKPQPMEDVGIKEFERIFAVNARSVYLSARHIVPLMKAQQSGVILNIASTGGVSPRPGLSWYNASKGWVITASKSMAVELAPHGIRVNAINPVAGETPLLKTFMGEDTPEIREKFLASIPIGRFSTPGDIGNAACFLCSGEASMITGVAMEVDGGRCV